MNINKQRQEQVLRTVKANDLILAIASCGRKFFRRGSTVATLELDLRGRVWFWDDYTGKRIYTHYRGEWRGFSHGGTLKAFVEKLRDYIKKGTPLDSRSLGPWPQWYCNGDLWAYGIQMEKVRNAAKNIGLYNG